MKTSCILAGVVGLVIGLVAWGQPCSAEDCELWTRYYGAPPNSTAYPMYRYERYSPAGRPYPWSIQHYYPPPASLGVGRYGTAPPPPVPRYRFERYSPAGYPYPESRVDYYPPPP